MKLEGRRALITGGNGGIGLAIASAFVGEGADVTIVGTNDNKLSEASALLEQSGRRIVSVNADVSDAEQCRRAVETALGSLGGIDILVNGAGVYISRRFVDYSVDEYSRVMSVNVDGTFHMCQAVLGHMTDVGFGRIINIASSAGKWASRNQAVYNMSKHAVIGLTRCLALECAPSGITVNALCPGLVHTDMSDALEREQAEATGTSPSDVHAAMLSRIAIGRYLEPHECGPLAVLLASEESAAMTGQSIMVDGGMVFV
jgi:NAD(P)-dependent dehydrogenase (short-subunit alcohol dehydrogenase family)